MDYNDWYDSKLFEPGQAWDAIEYESDSLKTVIEELYQNQKGIRYDFAEIGSDVLGSIYEQYLGKVQQGDAKTSKRKQQGIYYTPRYIVDFIVRNTIGEATKGKLANDIAQMKVLDPACGSGSFLTRAFEFLGQSFTRQGWDEAGTRLAVVPRCIYGIDLDDEAVEIAQLNLLLRMVYKRDRLPNLSHNVERGNSLISDTALKDKHPFDWHERFADVFKNGGFDVVIGNPPYIKEDVDKSVFDGLHESPYYQGKMDIWTLFACQAIDHLKDGGYFSFIAPSSWLANAGASVFRDKILKEGEIVSFIDFGDFKVFKDAGIQTMIFVFKKGKPRERYVLHYSKINNSEIAEDAVAMFLGSNRSNCPDGIVDFDLEFEPRKFINGTISFSDSSSEEIIGKIEGLQNFHFSDDDISCGIDVHQDFVNAKHLQVLNDSSIRKGEGIFILFDREVVGLNLQRNELDVLKPYYESDRINRYLAISDTDTKIIYGDRDFRIGISSYPHLKAHFDKLKNILTSDSAPYGLHRPREPRFFDGRAVFSLRKTAQPAFAYAEFPCYVSQSFYVIKPQNVNLKYLTALFNSKLSYFWFKNRGKMQGDNLQIDKEPLMRFPVRLTDDKKTEQKIAALVDKVMALNAELHRLDSVLEREKCGELKDEIKKIESEIDQEIYKIYALTPEEIAVVEKG